METISKLRALAEQTTDEKQVRWIISQIAQVTRQYKIANGIGMPRGPVEHALEVEPGYRVRPHLQYLSDRIANAVRDVERGKNRMLTVSMPPRAGKSTLLSFHTPTYLLRRHPDWKIMMASYDGGLASKWATNVRTVIEDHPDLGIALKKDGGKGSRWETIEGGSMYTTSVRGTMTGRGARVMIIDDPVKDFVEAHSLAYRQNLWNWWLSVAQTRLEPPYLVIVVMTRWHEDDFIGRILSKDHEGDPRDWEKIALPAIAEEGDVLGRPEGTPLITPLYEETPEDAIARWEQTRINVGTYTFCTPAESPVLMADWTTKPISEVKVGDLVMGYRRGTSEKRMIFEPTIVEEKSVRIDRVQRMRMESGAEVRCTKTHRWYTGRGPSETEPHRKEYAPATVGSKLLRYVPVLPELTPQRQRDLDYIAGMLDGEGHFRSNVVTISQSPSANPEVWSKINEVLSRLGWSYRVERGFRPEGGEWGSYRLRDTRAVIHELLERTDLAKRQAALDAQWSSPRKPCRERDRVVEIVPEGEEPVYALQTGTGNYVVWGYASSNSSMYQQRPAPAKGAIFDSGWWRFWTMDPDKATDDGRVVYLDPSSLVGGQWVDSWDANFESQETSRGGWVVAQRWVRSGANRYLVAQMREKWNFTETLWAMRKWAGMPPDDWDEEELGPYDPWTYTRSPYGNLVHERLVEKKANGAALINTVRDQIAGIKPINPTTSKENRARAITPECESGNVFLPHPSDPGNEWVNDLLSELRNFPHDAHDDQVDALTQALSHLRGPGRGGVTNPARPRPGQTWQRPRNVAAAAMSDLARHRGGGGFTRGRP